MRQVFNSTAQAGNYLMKNMSEKRFDLSFQYHTFQLFLHLVVLFDDIMSFFCHNMLPFYIKYICLHHIHVVIICHLIRKIHLVASDSLFLK